MALFNAQAQHQPASQAFLLVPIKWADHVNERVLAEHEAYETFGNLGPMVRRHQRLSRSISSHFNSFRYSSFRGLGPQASEAARARRSSSIDSPLRWA